MILNIVFVGVGGQGIVVSSDIFCEAALLDGFDVAKAETHGMAQIGGSIIAHARIGDDVVCPLIERGTSDIILGFEILETVRALPMLKKKGKVITNMQFIPPNSVLQGLFPDLDFIPPTSVLQGSFPDVDELINIIRKKARHVYEVNGTSLAIEAGNALTMSIVLLGALLAASENPVSEESIRKAISHRLEAKYLNVNLKALQLGRKSVL